MGTADLDTVIKMLEAVSDKTRVVKLGFAMPHSYRGYYEDLAFEPAENVTIQSMLDAAQSAVGQTFTGYKGGEYTMTLYTTVWLAKYGETGETLGPLFLSLILANTV